MIGFKRGIEIKEKNLKGGGKEVCEATASIERSSNWGCRCDRWLGFRQSLACWAVNERGISLRTRGLMFRCGKDRTTLNTTVTPSSSHMVWSWAKFVLKKSCGRFACVSKYSWYHIVSYSFEDAWQSEPQNRKEKHLLSSSCTTPVLGPPLFDEEEAAHVDDEPVKAVPEPDSVDALCW